MHVTIDVHVHMYVRTVYVHVAGEGPEFDVSVLMETTVNNCNILHVCCGREDGFMTTFDPSLGERRTSCTCTLFMYNVCIHMPIHVCVHELSYRVEALR